MSNISKNETFEGLKDNYFLDNMSSAFESGANNMMSELQSALEKLEADPSNPSVLANYQAKLQEYTLFRSAQSSTIKAYSSICKDIIQKF